MNVFIYIYTCIYEFCMYIYIYIYYLFIFSFENLTSFKNIYFVCSAYFILISRDAPMLTINDNYLYYIKQYIIC